MDQENPIQGPENEAGDAEPCSGHLWIKLTDTININGTVYSAYAKNEGCIRCCKIRPARENPEYKGDVPSPSNHRYRTEDS
jgi:hypothetical protein